MYTRPIHVVKPFSVWVRGVRYCLLMIIIIIIYEIDDKSYTRNTNMT